MLYAQKKSPSSCPLRPGLRADALKKTGTGSGRRELVPLSPPA
jgi:hypothetical protein